MTTFHILSLLLLSISYAKASNFTVALEKCKGDTDVIHLDSLSITCDGSEYCTWGSVADLKGVFTIQFDLESSIADIKAKAFGYKKKYEGIDICSYVDNSLNPDVSCPNAGTYSFDIPVTLPEEAKERWYHKFIKKTYYGKNDVKFDFEEIDTDVKCKAKVYAEGSEKKKGKKKKKKKSKSSDDDDDDDYVTSAAALVLVGAAAAFGINRRRRVETIGSSEGHDGEATSDFEMMGNNKDNVIMVH
jgi:hypothetical protein